MSEQMTHFGNGESKQGTGRCSLIRDRLSGRQASHCANTCKARFVDYLDRLRVAQLLQDVATQIVTYQIGEQNLTQGEPVEQALHSVGSRFPSVLGQLPAIFTLGGTHDALQIG